MLGAESTGKTTLAAGAGASALARRDRPAGRAGRRVPARMVRRATAARRGPTSRWPSPPSRRAASTPRAAAHDMVIADTTALMIAVYSRLLFDDRIAVCAMAVAAHRRIDAHAADRARPALGGRRPAARRPACARAGRRAAARRADRAGLPWAMRSCGSGARRGSSSAGRVDAVQRGCMRWRAIGAGQRWQRRLRALRATPAASLPSRLRRTRRCAATAATGAATPPARCSRY